MHQKFLFNSDEIGTGDDATTGLNRKDLLMDLRDTFELKETRSRQSVRLPTPWFQLGTLYKYK